MKSCVSVVKVDQVSSLVLASPGNHKLDRWKNGLNGYAQIAHIKNLDSLKDELSLVKPEVLLLDHDLPGLDGPRGITHLRELSPDTKIVMLSGPTSDDDEWAFFRAGVRGYCSRDIDPQSLKTLVGAVQQGELWIRRTLTYRLLEQLGDSSSKKSKKNKIHRDCLSQLASLTLREYEIALRVSNGENNKEISRSLDITERTVKAHLTEVYRKLGVDDRVKLAVILSGDERHVRRNSP